MDGKDVPLMPGMAASAEIATDQRSPIEFTLAPIPSIEDESLGEH